MGVDIYTYLSVFLMGLLGIWKAIPLGFALGMSPEWVYSMTILGAVVAAFVIYFFADQIRKQLARKKEKTPTRRYTRANRLFQKYGTAGLGFLGTFLIGPNATLLIGLMIVSSSKRLLLWTIIGILFWSIILTVGAATGIELFRMAV